jgi:hypothetical protein
MLLILRSLLFGESVSAGAAASEESSGGFWPARLIDNLREAARRSAVAYLRRAFARAKAGDVTATGGASSVAPIQDASAEASKLHASTVGCLPSSQRTLRSPLAAPRRATASASTEMRTAPLYAEGILGISDDELVLLMLAAA